MMWVPLYFVQSRNSLVFNQNPIGSGPKHCSAQWFLNWNSGMILQYLHWCTLFGVLDVCVSYNMCYCSTHTWHVWLIFWFCYSKFMTNFCQKHCSILRTDVLSRKFSDLESQSNVSRSQQILKIWSSAFLVLYIRDNISHVISLLQNSHEWEFRNG